MKYTFTSSNAALIANGRGMDVLTPWNVIIDTDEKTLSVSKRNRILIGKDTDTLAFHFIRRVTIDEHLIGADITIKAVGGTLTAYCLDKDDCKRIQKILMDHNRTNRSKQVVFN